MNASLVNWAPWSVLKISGVPLAEYPYDVDWPLDLLDPVNHSHDLMAAGI